ncbi:MAG: GGDEF domain-containing protein [Peptococcaceae bacterium]|nr:GGDEF domain-containing protein [Peptococcaceae bacterium]
MKVDSQMIEALRAVTKKLLEGKIGDTLTVEEAGENDAALREFLLDFNQLINHINEINRFSKELSQGNLDAELPGRRNYLAGSLKALYGQFSTISWNMEQLARGYVVGKIYHEGRLFTAYNNLLGKIAMYADQSQAENEDVKSGGQEKTEWNWSVNSWRYHQILAALNNLHIMVLEVDMEGKLVYLNRPARDYIGNVDNLYDSEHVAGVLVGNLLRVSTESEDHKFPIFQEVFDEQTGSWYKITSDKLELTDGRLGYLHMIDDISEWKRHETSLRKTASTDALTEVNNRWVGVQSLKEALTAAPEVPYCAAFIDIDNLKTINDVHGHNEGDFAIKGIANVLRDSVRSQDMVCRYGGDEFLIVFRCKMCEAEKIILRMKERIEEYSVQSQKPYRMDFSYGLVSIIPDKGQSVAELLAEMDHIMYEQKRLKKGR